MDCLGFVKAKAPRRLSFYFWDTRQVSFAVALIFVLQSSLQKARDQKPSAYRKRCQSEQEGALEQMLWESVPEVLERTLYEMSAAVPKFEDVKNRLLLATDIM